jgi:hypothetical protein
VCVCVCGRCVCVCGGEVCVEGVCVCGLGGGWGGGARMDEREWGRKSLRISSPSERKWVMTGKRLLDPHLYRVHEAMHARGKEAIHD